MTNRKKKKRTPKTKEPTKRRNKMRDAAVALLAQAIRDGSALEQKLLQARQILERGEPELCSILGGQDKLWRLLLPRGKTVDAALAENLFGITDAVNGRTPD